jgi:hypothetical protein
MSVVGAKANIADQRSSKSAVGSLFASTVRPFNKVVPSVQGKCDLMAAPVAATVSRATATNPVIVRCFVIRTSSSSKPTRVGHGNFAKVQQRRDKVWTAPEQKAVTSAVGRLCCKSRKSNNPKNLAKADPWTSLRLRSFSSRQEGPWSILDEAIWSLTSPRVKRISGSKNFRSTPQKDFCNNIGTEQTFRSILVISVIG